VYHVSGYGIYPSDSVYSIQLEDSKCNGANRL
jgi:hypothetical protein